VRVHVVDFIDVELGALQRRFMARIAPSPSSDGAVVMLGIPDRP